MKSTLLEKREITREVSPVKPRSRTPISAATLLLRASEQPRRRVTGEPQVDEPVSCEQKTGDWLRDVRDGRVDEPGAHRRFAGIAGCCGRSGWCTTQAVSRFLPASFNGFLVPSRRVALFEPTVGVWTFLRVDWVNFTANFIANFFWIQSDPPPVAIAASAPPDPTGPDTVCDKVRGKVYFAPSICFWRKKRELNLGSFPSKNGRFTEV